MTLYKLQERYWVGGLTGYYKTETLETFEDLGLAEKERDNMKRRGIGSCVFFITKTEDDT